VSGNLSPQELLSFGQSQVRSDDVKTLDDFVAGNLDFVDKEVGAVLVHGQVVEGGDEDRNQNLEDVFERSASLQVSASKVGELFLKKIIFKIVLNLLYFARVAKNSIYFTCYF